MQQTIREMKSTSCVPSSAFGVSNLHSVRDALHSVSERRDKAWRQNARP